VVAATAVTNSWKNFAWFNSSIASYYIAIIDLNSSSIILFGEVLSRVINIIAQVIYNRVTTLKSF
jgi:hypothetical protein